MHPDSSVHLRGTDVRCGRVDLVRGVLMRDMLSVDEKVYERINRTA